MTKSDKQTNTDLRKYSKLHKQDLRKQQCLINDRQADSMSFGESLNTDRAIGLMVIRKELPGERSTGRVKTAAQR